MTLVNVWTRDFSQHIARTVAAVEHHQILLPPIGDTAGMIVRASESVDGIALTVTGLTREFQEKLVGGVLNGVLTIEDHPAFAFICTEARWESGTLHIAAIPYITHLRRSALPDWYIPDERFC
ncbi:hypothetical protein JF780_05700 [Mycobacterium intracellulare]|uniref:hypothetical protein n=1 Tax=Mycobacterium intracellulare TaxID=1767 RepID=UPI001CDA4BBC|nr:hypothetical protein [Mycobacterium intracellulare]MCA2275485.1 hypothetical protein [Mycobacterium intracellulare]MCA2324445.1 hypothetical protein [Mycobacterium intracellulare]